MLLLIVVALVLVSVLVLYEQQRLIITLHFNLKISWKNVRYSVLKKVIVKFKKKWKGFNFVSKIE